MARRRCWDVGHAGVWWPAGCGVGVRASPGERSRGRGHRWRVLAGVLCYRTPMASYRVIVRGVIQLFRSILRRWSGRIVRWEASQVSSVQPVFEPPERLCGVRSNWRVCPRPPANAHHTPATHSVIDHSCRGSTPPMWVRSRPPGRRFGVSAASHSCFCCT